MSIPSAPPEYMVRTRVAKRYGKHSKSIKRGYEKNQFPKPDLVIGIFEYWSVATLDEFDRQRAIAAAAKRQLAEARAANRSEKQSSTTP
jgi:hypothetical protein